MFFFYLTRAVIGRTRCLSESVHVRRSSSGQPWSAPGFSGLMTQAASPEQPSIRSLRGVTHILFTQRTTTYGPIRNRHHWVTGIQASDDWMLYLSVVKFGSLRWRWELWFSRTYFPCCRWQAVLRSLPNMASMTERPLQLWFSDVFTRRNLVFIRSDPRAWFHGARGAGKPTKPRFSVGEARGSEWSESCRRRRKPRQNSKDHSALEPTAKLGDYYRSPEGLRRSVR